MTFTQVTCVILHLVCSRGLQTFERGRTSQVSGECSSEMASARCDYKCVDFVLASSSSGCLSLDHDPSLPFIVQCERISDNTSSKSWAERVEISPIV